MLYSKKPRGNEEYRRYFFCKEFGWDFYTYESQPPFLLDEFEIIHNQISIKQEQETKKKSRPKK